MKDPICKAVEVTGCNRALAVRLAALFLSTCLSAGTEIKESATSGKWDELAANAHKLKSGLAMFADEKTTKLCEEIESEARRGSRENIESNLDEFLSALETTKSALESALAS